MTESCFHEIKYECWDYAGNSDGYREVDFIVDCDGPVVEKEVGQPQYGEASPNFVNGKTTLWFNATDTGCLPGGSGVCYIVIKVYWQEYFATPGQPGPPQTLLETIIVTDGGPYDKNGNEGEISYEFHFKEDCCHELVWWGVDCLGTQGNITKQKHYVDLQPPNITKILPVHGYDEISPENPHSGYLKAGEKITLIAEDNDTFEQCISGLEALFYRWTWDGNNYPPEWDTSDDPYPAYNGTELGEIYDIDDPEILDHWWYRVDSGTADIIFDEECRHDLYYWAIDNVWKYGKVHNQTYYVDNKAPCVKLDLPEEHGYIVNDSESGYLKEDTIVTINASDLGTEGCVSGIESIFWRYEYEEVSYPICESEDNIYGYDVIFGEDLPGVYGDDYDDINITQYCWFRIDEQELVDFWFTESCTHKVFYFAKDNLCHRTDILNHTFYVDDDNPYVEIEYPDHGWYPEGCNPTPVCKEYLKVDTNITLKAYDLPDNECNTSIESIFWRYVYETVSYPLPGTPGTWDGTVIAEAYGYEDPDIEDFWWYRVDDDTANVSFDEGCRHDLFYWAKDNVCHKSGIYEKTFFVDNETPEIELEFLGHGYYKDQYCNEYLKGNESFIITATDFPDNECESGIEGIFWRYVYEDVSYPMEDDPEGWNGTEIAETYDYTDPNIIDHWWYYTDSYETFFEFKEQCQHDLYFWAKDNVCNPSAINHTTFYVDDTEPTLMLNVSGHGYYNDTDAQKEYLRVDKKFTLEAEDDHECASGVETIFWRYMWDDEEDIPNPGYQQNVYGYDIIWGGEIANLYGDEYDIWEITEFWWFRVNQSIVDVWFTEECQHDLVYFAKDNVCNRTELFYRTFFVDNSIPEFDPIVYPSHGYYQYWINEVLSIDYLKCGVNITLNTYDMPDDECMSGIESLFWRYDYDGLSYPLNDSQEPNAVNGSVLSETYGYDFPEIANYWWYFVDNDTVNVSFDQECMHKLFYWSKDNTCHNSTIYNKTFYVDNSKPYVDITYPDHGYTTGVGDIDFEDWAYEIPPGATANIVTEHYGYYSTPYTAVYGDTFLELKTDGPGSYTSAKKDFDLLTGDILSGHAAFDARDYLNDQASVVVRDDGGIIIATPWYCDVAMIGDFADGPWTYWDWTAPADGIYTLEFRITNEGDSILDSYALFDMPGEGGTGKAYLKCGTNITLDATDLPDNECMAGIEGIFWRYMWNDEHFPPLGPNDDPDVVTGAELAEWYDYTDDALIGYNWYFIGDDTVNISFSDECMHKLYYWAKDNVCHNSTIYNKTFYVDNTKPYVTIDPPDHGYFEEIEGAAAPIVIKHLKADTNITLNAFDDDTENEMCIAGIEGIFWRYYWDGQYFPPLGPNDDPDVVTGDELAEWYDYTAGDLIDYNWYYTENDSVNVSFPQECEHDFYYWAKDNVCHNSTVNYEKFFVDKSKPTVTVTYPDHGYYEDQSCKEYLKCYTNITLDAFDFPEGECWSGIESIFWRYEWNNTFVPAGPGKDVVTGAELKDLYGYTDPALIGYNWTFINKDTVNVSFPEECQHEFYYWAKDNLCHNSTIYHETFYVDNNPPNVTLEVGDPKCVIDEKTFKVNGDTWIYINATDLPENECAAGVENIFWRYTNITGLHPKPEEPGSVPGEWLKDQYGYTDSDIYKYWWYYNITPASVAFQFENECEHDLFYWAKDNVCNRTDIFDAKFYVDMTPPPEVASIKEVGDPHAKLENDSQGNDQWLVFIETPICFNLSEYTDLGCGSEDFDFGATLWYRIWYLGVWSEWQLYSGCIYLENSCVHYLEAKGIDCLGNEGPVDNETFYVCGPGGETGPKIEILEPDFGSTHCTEYVTVKINASDDVTAKEDLDIVVWIPGGRRDAPSLWYYPEYNSSDGFFYVDIPIYNYQSGAHLTLMALAKDGDNNVEFAEPTEFVVCSTIIWDQWLQYGWNQLTIPFGMCSEAMGVDRILDCLNNSGVYMYDGIFHYDPDLYPYDWGIYSPNIPSNLNDFDIIKDGEQYWIHCIEPEGTRYYLGLPEIEIVTPEHGETYDGLDEINGIVWSSDADIEKVEVRIYYYNETSVKHFWNGTDWVLGLEKLPCVVEPGYQQQWSYNSSSVQWIPGATHYVRAQGYDQWGCSAVDINTFDIMVLV